jgi:hypothetical protein
MVSLGAHSYECFPYVSNKHTLHTLKFDSLRCTYSEEVETSAKRPRSLRCTYSEEEETSSSSTTTNTFSSSSSDVGNGVSLNVKCVISGPDP